MELHYTKCVSDELTKTLDEAGMRITSTTDEVGAITVYNPTYAEVFDWLLCKGVSVELTSCLGMKEHVVWAGTVSKLKPFKFYDTETKQNWWEEAETAILKALKEI